MGSPLGPAFANFYMGSLEERVLDDLDTRPLTYCRYVDDIYLVVKNEQHLENIKRKMTENSSLTFTYEVGVENKLPFLDVLVDGSGDHYVTRVYRKETNNGKCLNAASECVDRYKTSVIRAAIRRAKKICSSEELFWSEIDRCKQVLVNNGYSNRDFDRELHKIVNPRPQNNEPMNSGTTHKIYYCNQMTDGYRVDERVLRDIISVNTSCVKAEEDLKLIIYYKNKKTRNFIMRNNLNQTPLLQCTRTIYEYVCPDEDCKPQGSSYIGHSLTTLSRRLTMHKQNGAILEHVRDVHKTDLTRENIVNNTKIIRRINDPIRLQIAESLLIKKHRPIINRQDTGFTRKLQLFSECITSNNNTNFLNTINNNNNNNGNDNNNNNENIDRGDSGVGGGDAITQIPDDGARLSSPRPLPRRGRSAGLLRDSQSSTPHFT